MILLEVLVGRFNCFVRGSGWKILWFCWRCWLKDSMVLLEVLVGRLNGFVGGSGWNVMDEWSTLTGKVCGCMGEYGLNILWIIWGSS